MTSPSEPLPPSSAPSWRTLPQPVDLPIAMFDSGVGGLTVLHECLVSLPQEDFVYLGDDARFPYGARSAEELRETSSRSRGSCSIAARSCW